MGRPPPGRGARLPDDRAAARAAHGPAARPICTRSCARRSRGRESSELYAHQAEAWASGAHGRARDRHDGDRVGQDARLQPAGARRARDASRRTARSTSIRRRRSRRIRRARSASSPCRGVRTAIYDGDTPSEQRPQIRKGANLILTNPDMLHLGVLPRHDLLGGRPAQPALRRRSTRRTSTAACSARTSRTCCAGCAASRASTAPTRSSSSRRRRSPTRASSRTRCSATPPSSSGTTRHRAQSGRSRCGTRELLDAELGLRASALGDAARLLAALVDRDLRTICFAKSRKAAELMHRMAADRVDSKTAKRLAPYRAGYTPQQRRDIEQRLVAGELLGVVVHRRARARHRHRPARLRDLGRLSRHGREPPPAMGPRGPPWTRARRDGRVGGRARPVLHARARDTARPARRGGDPRPREPARARRSRRGGRVRGSDRRR